MIKINEKKIKKNISNSKEKKEYKSFNKTKNNYILNTNNNSKDNKISKNKQNNKKNKIFLHKNRMTKKIMEKKEKEKEKEKLNQIQNHNQNQKIFNNYKLKKYLKINNQKQNFNTNFNSNSLFIQKNYKPKLNKIREKEVKENYINKSSYESNDDNEVHSREKKSSISQYIFNEDYRIKDDIESNSNYNDIEINKNLNIKNINENNNNIYNDYNYRKSSNSNLNKSSLNEDLSIIKINNNEKMVIAPPKKKKYIFKIKIKDEFIKLIINKGDDIYFKINEFCEENNLDEEDKEQILEAVNLKLLDN